MKKSRFCSGAMAYHICAGAACFILTAVLPLQAGDSAEDRVDREIAEAIAENKKMEKAQKAEKTDALEENSEPATVVYHPYREAILAARIDGHVLENKLRQGQRFKRNELLVKLDDRRFLIELDRVRALEKENIATHNFAKTFLKNQQEMLKEDLINEIECEKAALDVETTAARLQAIKVNLKDVQNQLLYCEIRAPFDGRIEEILTRSHETVRAGQPVLRVIDDNYLKAVVFVPVTLLKKLTDGREVELSCTQTGGKLKGKVYEIVPRADHRSELIEIHILVANPDGSITSGMTGEFDYARYR